MSAKTLTIIPHHPEQEHFFTLHLPSDSITDIRSGNAKIIRRDGNCIYIKTCNLQKDNVVVVGTA